MIRHYARQDVLGRSGDLQRTLETPSRSKINPVIPIVNLTNDHLSYSGKTLSISLNIPKAIAPLIIANAKVADLASSLASSCFDTIFKYISGLNWVCLGLRVMVGGLGSRALGLGTSSRLLCWGNHLIIVPHCENHLNSQYAAAAEFQQNILLSPCALLYVH